MTKFIRRVRIGCLGLCLISPLALFAYEHLTVESMSLGDGRFCYRLTMHDDPFYMHDDTLSFQIGATGVLDITVTPPGWTVEVLASEVVWASNFDALSSEHMLRPAHYDFGLRSAFSSHRLGAWFDGGSIVCGLLTPIDMIQTSPYSKNMAYYVALPAVIPCPVDQADGSPPRHSETYEMFESLEIESYYIHGKALHGLNVRYNRSTYTAVVKARRHLRDPWTDIAQFAGEAGVTCWVSDIPLKHYGNFFCVALVSLPWVYSYAPLSADSGLDAMPLAAEAAGTEQATLPFKLSRQRDGSVRIAFDTKPNGVYVVQMRGLPDGHRIERLTAGTGERVEVVFETPPPAASVRVSRLD